MPTILEHERSHETCTGPRRATRWSTATVLALLLTPTTAVAQDKPVSPTRNPSRADSIRRVGDSVDQDGFWTAPQVFHVMIAHAAENSCIKRSLTPGQCAEIGAFVADNWSKLIEENRDALQPLLDEYLDMRLGAQPPRPEQVSSWAERAEPVIERLSAERRATRGQAAGLPGSADGEPGVDVIEVGLDVARERLARWKRGDYEQSTFWGPAIGLADPSSANTLPPPPTSGEGRTDTRAALPVDPIALELLGWAKYVEEFAGRYHLDAAQRDAATSCLLEMTQHANAHRERHLEDVWNLERQLVESPQTPDRREELKRQIVRLYGPVDDMFAELKQRLEQIPTTEQRRRAEPGQREKADSKEVPG